MKSKGSHSFTKDHCWAYPLKGKALNSDGVDWMVTSGSTNKASQQEIRCNQLTVLFEIYQLNLRLNPNEL